nr:hypothetical protein [Candidatus Delongbacteria bacterium]
MKRVFVAVLIISAMIFAYAPKDESLKDMPKFFQGKIRVRLTEQAKSSKALIVKERDVQYLKTGIASLDSKNEQVKASSIKIDIIEAKNKVLAKKLGLDRWFTIEFPMDADVLEIVELYKSDPNVDIAQPEICYYIMATPNDGTVKKIVSEIILTSYQVSLYWMKKLLQDTNKFSLQNPLN